MEAHVVDLFAHTKTKILLRAHLTLWSMGMQRKPKAGMWFPMEIEIHKFGSKNLCTIIT